MAPRPVTETEDGVLVLSATQITGYLQCPRKYRFRYVDRLPREFRPSALAFGAAVHSATAWWQDQRLAGIPVTEDEALHMFHTDFEAQKDDVIAYKEDETEESLRTQGEALVHLYVDHFNEVPVAAIEQPFDVPIVDPETGEVDVSIRLRGFFDLILPEDTVVELKTAARSPDAATVARNLQMTAYAYGYREARGRDAKLRYVALVKTKTPKVVTLTAERSIAEQAWFVGLVQDVAAGIRAGVYPPNPGWACDGCEYAKACVARRARAALRNAA